jgi:hypothetical protein
MKIAKFKRVKYGYEHIADDGFDDCDGYIRVTEFVDVEFTDLPAEEVVPKQIHAIRLQMRAAQEEHAVKMAAFDEQIGKLSAITYQE